MNISIQKNVSHTCITVFNKKLDALMAPDFKSELVVIVENGEKNILVDLSQCDFCDSSGLSVLLLGNRLCHGAKGKFALFGLSNHVKEMINLAGFDTLLFIANTREEAEKLFV